MCKIYGYCRISRRTQSIERQIRNIKEAYPTAVIFEEAFTGRKIQGRKKLDALLKVIKSGDTIVFDSASRMSRNADEAIELYDELYNSGINLVFLKEPHINSDIYRKAIESEISVKVETGDGATDALVEDVIKALNKFSKSLARTQIKLVFDQAQKEVEDLSQRTSEGLVTAKINGKQIGSLKGQKYNVKKAAEAKDLIKKYSRDFNRGCGVSDIDLIKMIGCSRNSYYKYKSELAEEMGE